MMFPIDTTIPNAPNDPADDQPLMKDNFTNINSLFSVNHFVPGATNNGKHQMVEMPNQGSLPEGLVSGESTLYAKSVSGRSQIFFSPDATGNEYQLTKAIGTTDISQFATDPGWTFLPGGMLMQWGTNTSSSGATINFPITFTSPPYSIQCTIFQNTTNRHFVYARSSTSTGFVTTQLDSSGTAEMSTFTWIAIGK